MNEFNSGFGKAGCHIENIGELLQAFDENYVAEDGDVIKLSGLGVISLLGDLYDKFVESMQECEGKTIEIEFGDSPTANLLETFVKFILEFRNNTGATEA